MGRGEDRSREAPAGDAHRKGRGLRHGLARRVGFLGVLGDASVGGPARVLVGERGHEQAPGGDGGDHAGQPPPRIGLVQRLAHGEAHPPPVAREGIGAQQAVDVH